MLDKIFNSRNEKDGNRIISCSPQKILRSPCQSRSTPDIDTVNQIVASINNSAINKIMNRPICYELNGEIYCHSGYTRVVAAQKAEHNEIEIELVELDERALIMQSYMENVARSALTPVDNARSLARIRKINNWTLEQLGGEFNLSKQRIFQQVSIAELPPDMLDTANQQSNWMNEGILYQLTRIKNREAQWKIFNKIIVAGSQTTVQQVKRMVDSICGIKPHNEKKTGEAPQAHYSITPLGQSGFRMVLVFNGNNRDDLISAINKLKKMVDGGNVSEQPIISETHCIVKEALPDIDCDNANTIIRAAL